MLIERLLEYERKRVALFVPKAARESVWKKELKTYIPHVFGPYSNLEIYNHTDLLRDKKAEDLKTVKERADVVVIDEAHHFRNTGVKGEEGGPPQSRYWHLYDVIGDKTVYMLTATPVNNRLTDLQHMIELFSRRQPDYLKGAPLGIHSLPGHFRRVENALEKELEEEGLDGDVNETNLAEASDVLSQDDLYRALVVQHSRAYVKESQEQSGETGLKFFVPFDD